MLNKNDNVVGRYFDIVQDKIKELIAKDNKNFSEEQVEEFNNSIFTQEDEIMADIRNYVDRATLNDLDLNKVAKILYDKFKLQVKNNNFNKDTVNDIPNQLMGERKHIKTFEQFNDNEI